MKRTFNIIVLVSLLLLPFTFGCNTKIKPSEPIYLNYNNYITQNVDFDYINEDYRLTTTAKYNYHTIYIEIDYFKTEEQLKELKLKRFNEAKVIVDNLIKFNK